ncbi:hypothetical protein [Sphingobacterium kitahiroshimense]|uniref:Uncharacterized protein n=1 Tax=Sphingobacterium kitahiroshimense TaxID=470446 RepID=A0ABV0BVV2_9SPHI
MRTIIAALVVILSTLNSFAQQTSMPSDHLLFMDTPIDGELTAYVSKMQNMGFTKISVKNGTALLRGSFATYEDCFLSVSTLKHKAVVSTLSVLFPQHDTWKPLASNYYALKELLSEKYGQPTRSEEQFLTVTQPKDDLSKMYEVQLGKSNFKTRYELENGTIELTICNDQITSSYVKLTYVDKINGVILKHKALKDL